MVAEGLPFFILLPPSIPLVSEGSKGEFICLDAKSFVVNRLGEVREGRDDGTRGALIH